jgi:4a-hydroxytetrahydrobiopterin dehydratase
MTAYLVALHCNPLEGHGAMSMAEVDRHLRDVSGWALEGGAIEKTYHFEDYHRTMAFVNAVAWIAHREDHHPDIAFSYNRCTLRFSTHSVGGISLNDFICAAKVDALLS